MSWTPPVDPAFDLEARLQEFDERMKRDKVRAATRRRRIARLRDAHAGTAQTPREAPVGPQAAGEAAQEGDFCGWPPLLIEDLWHGPVCTVPWERCAVCNLEGCREGHWLKKDPRCGICDDTGYVIHSYVPCSLHKPPPGRERIVPRKFEELTAKGRAPPKGKRKPLV